MRASGNRASGSTLRPLPCSPSQSWARASSRSFSSRTLAACTVNPPAAGWPPKRSSKSAQALRAPSTRKPRGARTEARSWPPPSPASKATGRPQRSTKRAATMPMTP